MKDLRKIPLKGKRVETGPTQFGDDWPGIFIRGDNAIHFAHRLRRFLCFPDQDPFDKEYCWQLADLLDSCDARLFEESPHEM